MAGEVEKAVPFGGVLPRSMQFLIDIVVIVVAFGLSYLIRFEFSLSPNVRALASVQLPFVLFVYFSALHIVGAHKRIWRYVSIVDVRVFLLAVLAASAVLVLIRLFGYGALDILRVPFSIIILTTCFVFGGILGVRMFRRWFYECCERNFHEQTASNNGHARKLRRKILLIGAGSGGVIAAREIERYQLDVQVMGFVDDDPEKKGAIVHGVSVLGDSSMLPEIVASLKIEEVIITIANANRATLRHIVDICESIPIKMRIIPHVSDLMNGRLELSQIRRAEIEDILGRDEIQIDESNISSFIKNRRVLITGAGGSIGSELVRQVIRFAPAKVILVERSELALYDIDREIRKQPLPCPVLSILGCIENERRMRKIFQEHKPQIVIHAAAYKHVPLVEINPSEAVVNNVMHTWGLANIAGECGAETFVLISSDKAVNSSSFMGVTKYLGELIVRYFGTKFKTKFLAVRFGNVMGSTGSVIPLFREQIRNGGPVTVTHPDMVRFFMTIPEACRLILQASSQGDSGRVYVLDMGEPVNILQLAEQMIKLSGLEPARDINIILTGIRQGEKLFEELFAPDEKKENTAHPKVFGAVMPPVSPVAIEHLMVEMKKMLLHGSDEQILQSLNYDYVHDFCLAVEKKF